MSLNSTKKREIRRFGIIAFIFFGFLCGLGIWLEKTIPIFFFGSLATLGLGFILIPERLRVLYVAWLRIAHFIGKIVTILVLTLAYYLVITPSAMLKRLFGGIPLSVKPDKKVLSYCVARDEPVQPKERFLKRY